MAIRTAADGRWTALAVPPAGPPGSGAVAMTVGHTPRRAGTRYPGRVVAGCSAVIPAEPIQVRRFAATARAAGGIDTTSSR